jgi:hypothetical protein
MNEPHMVTLVDRHPDAVAWDHFEESNRDLFDLSTIGRDDPQYLRNRLRHAFEGGMAAARRMAENEGAVKL